MRTIKIVTDSTADMRAEEVHQLQIHVVPLSILIDGQTYKDGIDLSPKDFIGKMSAARELPKTSQPAVGEFVELYNQLGEDGSEVLSIHMTGNMSGTVSAAEHAAKLSTADVTVIDSRFVSKALGFQVKEAAKRAMTGEGMDTIVNAIKAISQQTKLYVVVETLENLAKGGRIGKGRALLGSFLKIKPIANLDGGEYSPIGKVRTHSQAVKFLAKRFVDEVKGKKIKGVGISHADGCELAKALKNKLIELSGYEDIHIDYTTPVISTHTGPGAIGFMFYTD